MRASAVIPTYDRPTKLERALDSVCDQTVDDYEVIVVDDGSETSDQAAVLDEFEDRDRITVLRQANAGPAAARNHGWHTADGEFILFTDDDCIVPTDWIETLVNAFEGGIAATGGSLVPFDGLLETNRFARAHRFRDQMNYGSPDEPVRGHEGLNVAGTANVAYRRSVLEEVGGFDESFPLAAGEDADLQKRVRDAGYQMKFVPITVFHNDDYDWNSFTTRAVRSGQGTYHFHQKHGDSRSVARVLAGLFGSIFYFPIALGRSADPTLATLYVLERMLNRWGELQCVVPSIRTPR